MVAWTLRWKSRHGQAVLVEELGEILGCCQNLMEATQGLRTHEWEPVLNETLVHARVV